MVAVVFLSGDWGYTKGGINVFNRQLCEAMMEYSSENLKIVCVAPNINAQTRKIYKQKGLILVNVSSGDFSVEGASGIVDNVYEALKLAREEHLQIEWIGHDTYSDDIALACKNAVTGSHCSLIHHMAYDQYYPMLNLNGEIAKQKTDHQKNTFKKADYIFANGPVLKKSAEDLLGKKNVVEILPGIVPVEKCDDQYCNNTFKVVSFGRIEEAEGTKRNNSIIKQIFLAVNAWSKFTSDLQVKDTSAETTLTVYGKNPEAEADRLVELFEENAEWMSALESLPYETNREKLLNDLASYSVCLTLSLREGFGLTAIEAISAGVPVIVSTKSGFYQALKERHLESYINGVSIRGKSKEPYYQEKDMDAVVAALWKVYDDCPKAKKDTIELCEKMKETGFSWKRTAEIILETLNIDYKNVQNKDQQDALKQKSQKNGKVPKNMKDKLNEYIESKEVGESLSNKWLVEELGIQAIDIEEGLKEYIKKGCLRKYRNVFVKIG